MTQREYPKTPSHVRGVYYVTQSNGSVTYGASGDGSTDDRIPIQAAIDEAVADGGGTVVVPKGTYIVTRVEAGTTDYCLNIGAGVNLHLQAGATIKHKDGEITGATGDDCFVINIAGDNVSITGTGTVDMNRAGQTDTGIGDGISARVPVYMAGEYDNVQIRDIEIKGAHGDGLFLNGGPSSTNRATNLLVQNIRMNDCREGILLKWADNVKIIGNNLSMLNGTDAQDGIETSGCNEIQINNNYVENAQGSGFDIYEQGKRMTLAGNIAKDCGNGINIGYNSAPTTGTHTGANNASVLTTTGLVAGAHVGEIIQNTTDGSEGIVTANTATTVTATLRGGTDNDWDTGDAYSINAHGDNIAVTGNVIEGGSSNNFGGIYVYEAAGAPRDTATRINISGNVIKGLGGTSNHGIHLNAGYEISVTDNIIRDLYGSGANGIVVAGDAYRCIVNSNSIQNTVAAGIILQSGSTGCLVSGNRIDDTGQEGIQIDADGHTITNNKISNTTGDGIELSGDNNLVNGNDMSGEQIDDNGTSNIKINNVVSAIENTGATTPIDHDNIIGGTWTT